VCEPTDLVEAEVVRTALATLPNDVRMVLWRSEVADEGVARDGMSAHNLAVTRHRARRALGTAYLAQHAEPEGGLVGLDPECRETLPDLAALVRNKLGIRRRRRVERHLGACTRCSATRARLEQINTRLRVHVRLPWELVTTGLGSTIRAQLSGWLGPSAATIAGSGALAVAVLAPAPMLVDEHDAMPSALRDRVTVVRLEGEVTSADDAADDEPTWATAPSDPSRTTAAAPVAPHPHAGPAAAVPVTVPAATVTTTTPPGAPPTTVPGQGRGRVEPALDEDVPEGAPPASDDDDGGPGNTTADGRAQGGGASDGRGASNGNGQANSATGGPSTTAHPSAGNGPSSSNGRGHGLGDGKGNGPASPGGQAAGQANGNGNGNGNGNANGLANGNGKGVAAGHDQVPAANPAAPGNGNGNGLAKGHGKQAAGQAQDDASAAEEPAAEDAALTSPPGSHCSLCVTEHVPGEVFADTGRQATEPSRSEVTVIS
jgi:hypothetical protein